jgi:hypothetical protein
MAHSLEDQSRLEVRSRTNAALVFGFHSHLRRVPTTSLAAAKPVRHPAPVNVLGDSSGPDHALGLVTQIAKWIAMLAAIAAPWVLLLTG